MAPWPPLRGRLKGQSQQLNRCLSLSLPVRNRRLYAPLYGPPPRAFHKGRVGRDLIAHFVGTRRNGRYDPLVTVSFHSLLLSNDIPSLGNASLRAVRRLLHVSYPFSLEKRRAEAEAFRQDGSLGGICASSSDRSCLDIPTPPPPPLFERVFFRGPFFPSEISAARLFSSP